MFRLLATFSAAVLSACSGGGSSESPPVNVVAAAEDGRAVVTWNVQGGNEYWLFSASNPALTATTWLNFADGRAIVNATSPNYVCGLANDTRYYFTLNARSGNAGGGEGSPLVSATPRSAGQQWSAGSPLGADLTAVGRVALQTCIANRPPTSTFVAVGAGAKIFSTSGAKPGTWAAATVPTGFVADLHGVAGRNNGVNTTAAVLFVAVGAGSATLVSNDVATWTAGTAFDAARPTLRAVTLVDSFVAVGDGGTIRSSGNGVDWTDLTSNTSANLRAIAVGDGRIVAVGDGGTIVTSTNGNAWSVQTFAEAGDLVGVAFGDRDNINTFVAIGSGGATVVSTDSGATWSVRRPADGVALRAISYTSAFAMVAADGQVYRSARGLDWLGPITSGTTGLSALTNDGFGFIAVGAGGANGTSY